MSKLKLGAKKAKTPKKTEKEKVEERREEVLSRGRKFKYPLQYAKHRVVIITIIVAIASLGVITGLGWFALYRAQDTGDILYRLTQILPVPVASVDGEAVRYSDYLMIYKSTITPVEQQQGQLGNNADADAMRAHYKRLALDEAENYTYALKLARELGVTVSEEEVDAAYGEHRNIGGVERSEDSFRKILQDNFGLTETEYRRMLYLSLVKSKVSEKIDTEAAQLAEAVMQKLIASDNKMQEVAQEFGEQVHYEETGGLVDKMNVDGGRSDAAIQLVAGEISQRLTSTNGDGYYIVKLIEKTDNTVNYASIKIPFVEFTKRLEQLRADGSVTEYIDLPREDNGGGV